MGEEAWRSRPWLGFAVFAYGSLAAACFSFLVYHRQSVIIPAVDLNGFGALARNLAEGEGFSSGFGPTIRRAPLFPLLAGALLKLFASSEPGLSEFAYYRPILIANCIFFGLTCYVVWKTASRLFGPGVGLLAAAACPLVPQSMRYVGMTEVETLMALFIALLAWTGVLFVEQPTLGRGVAFGASAAAATLTKPIVLLYPFGFVALAFWSWPAQKSQRRAQISSTLVMLGCFGALLLPWSLRNAAVTQGQFRGISGNAPGEFLRGYINAQPKYYLLQQDFGGTELKPIKWDPEANLYEEAFLAKHGVPFYRTARDERGRLTFEPKPPPGVSSAMLDVEKDRIEGQEMKRKLREEPGDFLRKFFIQLFTFWYIVETRTKSLLVGGSALVVLAFSVIGFVGAWRRQLTVWPIAVLLLYFNAIYAAFLSLARYSMPLYPTLMTLAIPGAVFVARRVFGAASGGVPSSLGGPPLGKKAADTSVSG